MCQYLVNTGCSSKRFVPVKTAETTSQQPANVDPLRPRPRSLDPRFRPSRRRLRPRDPSNRSGRPPRARFPRFARFGRADRRPCARAPGGRGRPHGRTRNRNGPPQSLGLVRPPSSLSQRGIQLGACGCQLGGRRLTLRIRLPSRRVPSTRVPRRRLPTRRLPTRRL